MVFSLRTGKILAPTMPSSRAILLICALLLRAIPGQLSAAEPLTSVAATRELSVLAAAEGRPVRLSGVVSYLRITEKDFNFNLHDATGGVMVYPADRAQIRPGQRVTVTGVTAMSVHGLRIAKATVEPGEMLGLPAPKTATLAEILDGQYEGDFVELDAIVRVVRLEAPAIFPRRLALDFGNRNRRLTAWITEYDLQDNPVTPGAAVRLRGVVLRWTNPRGQPQSTNVLVNSMKDLRVLSTPGDPPPTAIQEVLLWNGPQYAGTPVRTAGVVTFHKPGELTVLQQGGSAIRVRGVEETALTAPPLGDLHVGDRIEAVGFPTLGEYTVELQDARMTRTGSAPLPPPEAFSDPAAVLRSPGLVDRDARLITVPGTLRDLRERDGSRALEMESGRLTYTAWLPLETNLPATVRPGSELQLTGVCTLQTSDTQRRVGHPPDRFSLLLPNADAVHVLRAGPWWTARRLLLALGVMAGVAVLMTLWATTLRKKNRLLRQQILARERMQRQLAAERRRVAGELHDTLEQTLVAAALQLNAASRTVATQPHAASAQMSLAHQLVARSRQEVRDAVWDLHLEDAQQGPLSALLARICSESSPGAPTQVSFTTEGEEPLLPRLVTAQAVRLVREAIANALKHAQPSRVSVTMRVEAAHLQLTIADDGRGFDPASVAGPETGHFGLAGMEERLQRLGGDIRIVSAPTHGTTVHFVIPLAPP